MKNNLGDMTQIASAIREYADSKRRNKMPKTKSIQEWLESCAPIPSNPYTKRDTEISRLIRDFYVMLGAKMDDQITILEVDEQPDKVPFLGWTTWLGEEEEVVWFDGQFKGKMILSCRGGQYITTCALNGKEYKATDETSEGWIEVVPGSFPSIRVA